MTDPFTPRYFGSTFRCTQTDNASGSLTFKGTGVWVYGAKRDNHGMFEMDLDGQVTTSDGYGANKAQELLFGQGGLDPDVEHTVVSRLGGITCRLLSLRFYNHTTDIRNLRARWTRNSRTRLRRIKVRGINDRGLTSIISS
jgi:hypothetical protein